MTPLSVAPVAHSLITEILDVARRSPSGVNTQPWLVRVLMNPGAASGLPAAPCVLGFSIERLLGLGSQLDCGMFVGAVALAAHARGLATAVTSDLGDQRAAFEKALQIPEGELLLCIMAIGHADGAGRMDHENKTLEVTWLE